MKSNNLSSVYNYTVRIFLPVNILLVLLLLSGCNAPYYELYQDDEEIFKIYQDSLEIDSVHLMQKYIFESTRSQKINKISLHSENDSGHQLLVEFQDRDASKLSLVDLTKNKKVWTANKNLPFNLDGKGFFVLVNDLYDIRTGEYIRTLEESSLIVSQKDLISLNSDEIAKREIFTGKLLWKSPGNAFSSDKTWYSHENWLYVVDDGLYAINEDEGLKWKYETPTSFTNATETFFANLLRSCAASRTGGYYQHKESDKTSNMHSNPVIDTSYIYFAGIDKIYCFDKFSGQVNWEQNITPEMGKMSLANYFNNNLVLLTNGTITFNGYLQIGDYPTSITLFSKTDGTVITQFNLPFNAVLQDFEISEKNKVMYVVLPDKILQFDDKLLEIADFKSDGRTGMFVKILDFTNDFVIRTTNGILKLDLKTLAVKSFVNCTLLNHNDERDRLSTYQLERKEKFDMSLYTRSKEEWRSLFHKNIYLTPDFYNGKFKVFDNKEWLQIAEFDFGGLIGYWSGLVYRAVDNNKALILKLNEVRK